MARSLPKRRASTRQPGVFRGPWRPPPKQKWIGTVAPVVVTEQRRRILPQVI